MFSGSMKGFKAGGSISFDEASGSGTGFKLGGRVKKTGTALVHAGEYVLPKGIKPTKDQIASVKAIQKKASKTG
jgi:hypothetical protein